jgi:hypothetical protein
MFGRPSRRESPRRSDPPGRIDPHRSAKGGTTVLELLALSGAAASVLWVIAVILVIAGIVALVRGEILAGAALIIVGLLVGPGGVSIFK